MKAGSKYALFDGKNVYTLSDQKTPEQFGGQKVRISGTLYEKTKILKVDSISADSRPSAVPASSTPRTGVSTDIGTWTASVAGRAVRTHAR